MGVHLAQGYHVGKPARHVIDRLDAAPRLIRPVSPSVQPARAGCTLAEKRDRRAPPPPFPLKFHTHKPGERNGVCGTGTKVWARCHWSRWSLSWQRSRGGSSSAGGHSGPGELSADGVAFEVVDAAHPSSMVPRRWRSSVCPRRQGRCRPVPTGDGSAAAAQHQKPRVRMIPRNTGRLATATDAKARHRRQPPEPANSTTASRFRRLGGRRQPAPPVLPAHQTRALYVVRVLPPAGGTVPSSPASSASQYRPPPSPRVRRQQGHGATGGAIFSLPVSTVNVPESISSSSR